MGITDGDILGQSGNTFLFFLRPDLSQFDLNRISCSQFVFGELFRF
jgi:hypothetical protein